MQHGYLWSATFWFLPTQGLFLSAHVCKHHPCFLWLLHHQDGQRKKPGISASGFQGLILSKTFESHSKFQEPAHPYKWKCRFTLPMYCQTPCTQGFPFAGTLWKYQCSKKYQSQRFSWKSAAISWAAISASCYFGFSHSIGKSKGNNVKGKNTQKTRHWHSKKSGSSLFPEILRYQTQKHTLAISRQTFNGKFLLHSIMFVHHITRQHVPPSEERLRRKGQTLSSLSLVTPSYWPLWFSNPDETPEKLHCWMNLFVVRTRMPCSHFLSIKKCQTILKRGLLK